MVSHQPIREGDSHYVLEQWYSHQPIREGDSHYGLEQ